MSATIQDGKLEVEVSLAIGAANAWVDVTCDVDKRTGIALSAGSTDDAGPTSQWEAATAAFRLMGTDYDPFGGGTYSATVGPGVACRVRWRSLDAALSAYVLALLGGLPATNWFLNGESLTTTALTVSGGGATMARNASDAYLSSASAQITCNGAVNNYGGTPAGTSGVRCKPGERVTWSGYIKSLGVARSVSVLVVFYDNTGTQIGTSAGAAFVETTAWAGARPYATAVAPASTAYTSCRFIIATSAATERHLVSLVQCEKVVSIPGTASVQSMYPLVLPTIDPVSAQQGYYREAGADEGDGWRSAFTGNVTPDGWPYIGDHKLPDRSNVSVVAADFTARVSDASSVYPAGLPADTVVGQMSTLVSVGLVGPGVGTGHIDVQNFTMMTDFPGGHSDDLGVQVNNIPVGSVQYWGALNALAEADLGLLWWDRRGRLHYSVAGKVSPPPTMEHFVVCDTPPAVHAQDVGPNKTTVLANYGVLAGAKRTATVVEPVPPDRLQYSYHDFASVTRFGMHSLSDTALVNYYDDQTIVIASAVLTGSTMKPCPEYVALQSRLDLKSAFFLLGAEPSHKYVVQSPDGTATFRAAPIGWNAFIDFTGVSGTITLASLDRYIGGEWDSLIAKWDDASTVWGV